MEDRRAFRWMLLLVASMFFGVFGCAGMEAQKKYDAGLQSYEKAKNYDQAIKELKEAVQLDPKNASAQSLLGWCYVKKGKLDLAHPYFKKAVELDSGNISALGGMGLYYYASGKDKEAMETAREVLMLTGKVIQSEGFLYYSTEGKKFINDFRGDSYAILGMANQRLGKYEEATRNLEKALEKPASWGDPKDIRLHLAQSLQGAKKYDPALEEYSKVLSGDPKSVEALVGRGWLYIQKAKHDEAEKDFLATLRIQPLNASAAAGLVEVRKERTAQTKEAWDLLTKKDYDSAISAFKKAQGQHPNWSILDDGLGWSYYWKGMIPEAEEAFAKALQLDPGLPTSLIGKAWVSERKFAPLNAASALLDSRQYDKAITAFNEILQDKFPLFPAADHWRVHNGLGWAFYGKMDTPAATAEFQKVLAKMPGEFSAHQGLGYIHFQSKNYDQAIASFQASLKSYPGNVDVQSNLGWAYLEKGDGDKAIQAFAAAVNLSPYLADPYKGLAWSQWKTGKTVQAKESFAKAIAIFPGYVEDEPFTKVFQGDKEGLGLYTKLGWSYYQHGLFKEAQQKFEQVLAQVPEGVEALSGLGYVAYSQKNFDQAITYFEKTLEKETSWAQVRADLAWSYYFKENYSKAREEFSKSVSAQPQVAPYKSGLGWALYRLQDTEGARQAFQAALKLNPHDPSAIEGLKTLGQK